MATTISGRIMSAKALTTLCVLAIAIGALPSYSQPKDTGPATTAPAPTSQATITPEQIDQAIKDLGDRQSMDVRGNAADLLWRAGQAAVPALEQAAKGSNSEPAISPLERSAEHREVMVGRIAKWILADMEWNLFPNTPERIVNVIRQYRATDPEKKEQFVNNMFSRAGSMMPAFNRILSHETDEAIRNRIKEMMIVAAGALAPQMILSGDLDKAQALLERAAMGDKSPEQMQETNSDPNTDDEPTTSDDDLDWLNTMHIRNYVAFLLVSAPDKLDAKIKELSSAKDKRSATVLALAYRAKGDMQSALKVAKEHGVLLGEMLFLTGDWEAMAQIQEGVVAETQSDADDYITALGRQLAFYRLCGKKEEAQKIVEKIIQAAATTNGEDPQTGDRWWRWPKQLLDNEYTDQAIKLLMQHPAGMVPAFKLLVSQGRFADALELIEKTKDPKADLLPLKCEAIRLRYHLGQKEEALKNIRAILSESAVGGKTASAADGGPREPIASIISLYMDMGLESQSFALTEETFKDLTPEAQGRWLPEPLWWIAITRHNPKMSVKERGAMVYQLLVGTLDIKEVTALVEIAAHIPLGQALPGCPITESQRALGVYRVLLNYVDSPDLRKYFDLWLEKYESAPNRGLGRPEFELGANLVQRGKFAEGAAICHQALNKTAWTPLVAMEGVGLLHSGQREEGTRLLKLADMMLLGNDNLRTALAEDLTSSGQKELGDKQYEMALLIGEPRGDHDNNIAFKYAYAQAMMKKDFVKAARLGETLRIWRLNGSSDWYRPEAHLATAVQAHLPLAMEAKAKGDWEKYAAEIGLCQNALPLANSQPLIDAINDLTKAGKIALADALFDRSWKAGVKTCQDWPMASDYFNSRAWLAVACHRKINEAFNLAQQAVELDKTSSANLDTMAEIYFQKGDRTKAVELGKKSLELDAADSAARGAKESKLTDYYKRQLKRFQTMDPSTQPPQAQNDDQGKAP